MSEPSYILPFLKDFIAFLVRRAPATTLTANQKECVTSFPPHVVTPILHTLLCGTQDPIIQSRLLEAFVTVAQHDGSAESYRDVPASFAQEVLKNIVVNEHLSVELTPHEITLLNALPSDATGAILADLFTREADGVVRSRIFDALMHLRDFDRVACLITIYDKEPDWKMTCCGELARLNDQRAIDKLCAILLTDPDPDARLAAAEGLGSIGNESAISALEQARRCDTGQDYEGFSIAEAAEKALDALLRRYEEAEAHYQHALKILEQEFGPNHFTVGMVLESYAILLRRTNRADEAEKVEARARMIKEAIIDANKR